MQEDIIVADSKPDDREPISERREELLAMASRNVAEGSAPFAGVSLQTRGEILWIMREWRWSGEQALADHQRADLRGIICIGADLRGLRLDGANLSSAQLDRSNLMGARLRQVVLDNASLRECNLTKAVLNGAHAVGTRFDRAKMTESDLDGVVFSGSVLGRADLQRASMDRADFSDVSLGEAILDDTRGFGINLMNARLRKASLRGMRLRGANLHGARLWEADFSHADMNGVDLTGAHLRGANLQGTILQGARMDVLTSMGRVLFDSHTRLGDIIWNGVPLAEIEWEHLRRLGDEDILATTHTRQERIAALHQIARTYRVLVTTLRAQGITTPAANYRIREQQLERRAAWLEHRYGAWLFSGLLDLIAGYGELPGKALSAYVVIVLFFACIFWSATNLIGISNPLTPLDSLLLSLVSFHGRGFFTANNSLGEPMAVASIIEAIIGLFIELIFIATFSRRFLGE
jgi:uncharacterized protein YjbI with pentapeptide repeats